MRKVPTTSRPMIGGKKADKPKIGLASNAEAVRPAAVYGLSNGSSSQKQDNRNSSSTLNDHLSSLMPARQNTSPTNIEEEKIEEEHSLMQGRTLGGNQRTVNKQGTLNANTDQTIGDSK